MRGARKSTLLSGGFLNYNKDLEELHLNPLGELRSCLVSYYYHLRIYRTAVEDLEKNIVITDI